MDKINCIVCEKPIKFPSYIDPEDYDGHIFCHECNLLLYVRLKAAKVTKYKLAAKQPKVQPGNIEVKLAIPEYADPKKQKEK